MIQKTSFRSIPVLFLLLSLAGYCQTGLFKVQETFNSSVFEYELKELEQRDLHTVYAISFPSPVTTASETNNTVHGELFLPAGIPQGLTCPAVLINHILAGNFDLERLMCTTLANHGIVAMFIMMPYYGLRGKHRNPREILETAERFISSMHQGVQDNRRAVDILIARPEVTADRIGIAGGSLGAIISAGVCGFEPRIERVFLLMGGGNLEKIFRNPCRETEPFRKLLEKLSDEEQKATLQKLQRFDPISQSEALQRLSRNGKMKMICAAEDEVIPPASSRELADAAQCDIIWLPGVNHYTVATQSGFIFAELADFFSTNPMLTWRPAGKNGKVDNETMGLRLLAGFFRDLNLILGGVPSEGHAHHLGMTVKLASNGNNFNGELKLSRGPQGWYKVYADIPKLGQGWIGQGEFPWMAGAKDSLYVGSLNATSGQNLEMFISPGQLMNYQMGLGIMATGAMAPEMLKKYARLTVTREAEKMIRVAVDIQYPKFNSRLHLLFGQNGRPESGHFQAKNVMASFKITSWELDDPTHAAFFSPLEERQSQPVNQQDVLRMSAAIFERLLESMN